MDTLKNALKQRLSSIESLIELLHRRTVREAEPYITAWHHRAVIFCNETLTKLQKEVEGNSVYHAEIKRLQAILHNLNCNQKGGQR